MLYLKTKINNHIEIKVDLYDDEIFTMCPECGIEHEVDTEMIISILKNGGDFSSTSVYCSDCSKSNKRETK